jgi:hypothetical protein
MKPNLKVFSISLIRMSCKIELTEDLIQQIRGASPPDEDGDSVFEDIYKVGDNRHVGWATVTKPEKDGTTCHLYIAYALSRGRMRKVKLPLVDQALEILSNVDSAVELLCALTFEFAKRDKAKTIVSLPLILSESPNLPFNEIRGLHFSKMEGKRSQYDVILDRGEDGAITESLILRHTAKISNVLLDGVIKEAVRISNSFVSKKE